nr:thioesterase [Calditrichia bacterium]
MNVATEKFEMPITVDNSHIDQLGHVNNTVYLKWVQEAATAHWMARTTDAEKQTWYWVVT